LLLRERRGQELDDRGESFSYPFTTLERLYIDVVEAPSGDGVTQRLKAETLSPRWTVGRGVTLAAAEPTERIKLAFRLEVAFPATFEALASRRRSSP
jgi:hypothetical protein